MIDFFVLSLQSWISFLRQTRSEKIRDKELGVEFCLYKIIAIRVKHVLLLLRLLNLFSLLICKAWRRGNIKSKAKE